MDNQYPKYERTNQDRIQDAIFMVLALFVLFLFVGIPIMNMAHISLGDVWNWIIKR